MTKRSKGTGTVNRNGYIHLHSNGKHQFEHRRVMEQMLGRELLPDERVHHKNGIRSDNHPENLELWLVGHPPGQRVEDVIAWARGVLNRYSDLEEFAKEAHEKERDYS